MNVAFLEHAEVTYRGPAATSTRVPTSPGAYHDVDVRRPACCVQECARARLPDSVSSIPA